MKREAVSPSCIYGYCERILSEMKNEFQRYLMTTNGITLGLVYVVVEIKFYGCWKKWAALS